jgi:hypothetical protein
MKLRRRAPDPLASYSRAFKQRAVVGDASIGNRSA